MTDQRERSTLDDTARPAWFAQAACRNVPTDEMFPKPGVGAAGRELVNRARAVCEPCPVRAECFAYAVANGEMCGVWGGHYFGVGVGRVGRPVSVRRAIRALAELGVSAS
jgi:hypothetical protein